MVRARDQEAPLAGSVEDCGWLLASGSRALEDDGDLPAARGWFEQAYQIAERAPDQAAMATAALGTGGLWVHEHRSVTAAATMEQRVRQALQVLDPGSALSVRLRTRLAGEADYRSGDPTSILAVLKEATDSDDPVAMADALSIAHHCVLGPDHARLRRNLALQLIGVSSLTGRRSDQLMGLLWLTVDLFLDGAAHAERRLGELREQLATRDHLAVGFVVSALEVMLSIRAGRFDHAESLAAVCRQRGAQAGDPDAEAWYIGQLVAIRWYQGRLPELLPMLDELVSSSDLSTVDNSPYAALAVAAAQAGDRLRAAGALATLRGRDLADLPRSSSWLVTMNGIVEAAHLLQDTNTSARAYELLLPFAHLPMILSLGVASFGSVQHALGVACLSTGDLDRAVAHLRAAVQANLALGHWPAVLTSRLRHTEVLTLRNRPGDATAARDETAIMHEESRALGMAPPTSVVLSAPTGLAASVGRANFAGASCVRHGHKWRIEWAHRHVLVEHCVGMLHLTVLLANHDVEIPAIELVAGMSALSQVKGGPDASAQPVLDRAAVQTYRHRLSRLREQLDDPEFTSDTGRTAKARTEYDWLVADLASATGIGGRARSFTDNGERARLAVGKAIRRALDRIEQAEPLIGEHLRNAVKTGMHCSYRPSTNR